MRSKVLLIKGTRRELIALGSFDREEDFVTNRAVVRCSACRFFDFRIQTEQ